MVGECTLVPAISSPIQKYQRIPDGHLRKLADGSKTRSAKYKGINTLTVIDNKQSILDGYKGIGGTEKGR